MTIVNSFQDFDKTVYAQPGEMFGKIYLSDYLVMDEVAGHIINRSVVSVILRPKLEQAASSNRIYECSIEMKNSQLVIIKLNEVLCKDCVFEKDQTVCIDLKFRYNRLLMCKMHQAIDMCQQKTDIFLPSLKNVSNKYKVGNIVSAAIFVLKNFFMSPLTDYIMCMLTTRIGQHAHYINKFNLNKFFLNKPLP